MPGDSSPPLPPVCEVEIAATDSTAQDMLQDLDSEDENNEDEGEDSCDLNDDGEPRPH